MSKYVKNLISEDLANRLAGETDCLLVDVIGLDANDTMTLRRELRSKDIHLSVVKNSLARRATEGTPLAVAFESQGQSRLSGAVKTLFRSPRKWCDSLRRKRTKDFRQRVG